MRNIGEIIEAKEIVWNQGRFPLSLNTMFELNDIIISPDMMAVQKVTIVLKFEITIFMNGCKRFG